MKKKTALPPKTAAQKFAATGGRARAASLDSGQRSEIAKRAAEARWGAKRAADAARRVTHATESGKESKS